eukprot:117458-Hanusia_phi.AAC.1
MPARPGPESDRRQLRRQSRAPPGDSLGLPKFSSTHTGQLIKSQGSSFPFHDRLTAAEHQVYCIVLVRDISDSDMQTLITSRFRGGKDPGSRSGQGRGSDSQDGKKKGPGLSLGNSGELFIASLFIKSGALVIRPSLMTRTVSGSATS